MVIEAAEAAIMDLEAAVDMTEAEQAAVVAKAQEGLATGCAPVATIITSPIGRSATDAEPRNHRAPATTTV